MEYRNNYGTPRDKVSDALLSELLGENEPQSGMSYDYGRMMQSRSENGGTQNGCGCTVRPNGCRTETQSRQTPDCRGNYPDGRQSGWDNPPLTGNPFAMVYSPVQEFDDVFEAEEGLCHGTIFKMLDFPLLRGCSCR